MIWLRKGLTGVVIPVLLAVALAGCSHTSGTQSGSAAHHATANASANPLEQNGAPLAIDTPKHQHSSSGGVTYQGGAVQHHPRVYLIFWGPKWNGDRSGTVAAAKTFFGGLNGSPYLHILAQYPDDGGPPTDSTLGGVWMDSSTPSFSSSEGGDEALSEASRGIATNSWPVDGDTQVMVFPEIGTAIDGFTTGDTSGSSSFCGWHDYDQTSGAAYALVPYQPDAGADSGCDGSNDAAAITATAAHEWAEMATDPQGDAWTGTSDDSEIGDLCSDTAPDGPSGTSVQSLWSNSDGKCVFSTS